VTPRSIAATLAAALLLAGCGGRAGTSTSPSLPATSHARASLSLTITIPRGRTSPASSRLHPDYISASTQSLAISVAHGSTNVLTQSVGLTVASNPQNCTASGGATTCTVLLGLAPGSFTGTFSTYDGPVVSNAASGNVLSQGQSVPITVTAGQTNTLSVTLDGVPASITVAPASGSTISGTQSTGFVVPFTAQPVAIEALDADGNVILGPGAPTFSAQATAAAFTVTQPAQGTPNQITLAAAIGGTGTLTVTATPPDGGFSCSAPGVVCSASVSLTHAHTLFAAGSSGVSIFSSTDDVTWTLEQTNAQGVTFPVAIAAAPSGTLFLANNRQGPGQVANSISVYGPPYSAVPISMTTDVHRPAGLAVTAAGLLIDGENSSTPQLVEFASPWTGTPAVTPLSGLGGLNQIALDPSGDLIADSYQSLIRYSAPSFTSSSTIVATGGNALAFDSSGTLFAGSASGNAVRRPHVDRPRFERKPLGYGNLHRRMPLQQLPVRVHHAVLRQ
jgi:hypothetical protein